VALVYHSAFRSTDREGNPAKQTIAFVPQFIPTVSNATKTFDTIRPDQPRLDVFAARLVLECETSFRVCTMKLRNGSDKTEPFKRP
jgi:hypothetical protein